MNELYLSNNDKFCDCLFYFHFSTYAHLSILIYDMNDHFSERRIKVKFETFFKKF